MKTISFLKSFIPTGYPFIAAILAIVIAVAGTIISVLYGLSEPGPFIGHTFSILGLYFLSFAALIIEVGAWIEKRAAPRLTMGCGAVLMLAMSCGTLGISMYLMPGEGEAKDGLFGTICFSLPFLLIFAIPALLALTRFRGEMQTTGQQEREQRAIDIIHSKGIVTYAELSRTLRTSEDEVDRLLRNLVQNEKIQGVREVEHKRFYTSAKFAEKQLQLLGMIAARGEVRVADAAIELDVPASLLKEWIYALVQKDKFAGYINWDKGVLYSADAETLRQVEHCPQCGGSLNIAGKGVIQCHHCHTEVFLST